MPYPTADITKVENDAHFWAIAAVQDAIKAEALNKHLVFASNLKRTNRTLIKAICAGIHHLEKTRDRSFANAVEFGGLLFAFEGSAVMQGGSL